MPHHPTTGYAPVNGVEIYWESRGSGGVPLVVTHGGFGLASMFGDAARPRWPSARQVIAIELQGHGHTRDIDRPFSFEAFGDDVAGVIEHLGLGQADLLGYSLGGGASLRCAIQHPELVRTAGAVVSFRAAATAGSRRSARPCDQVEQRRLRADAASPRCTQAWPRSRPTRTPSRR